MAESSVHQSSHISSSAGEKSGSCAESHPKHPSPESPGSPFEMIANSKGFDFKESEDKANYGLSQISAQRPSPNQIEKTDEPLIKYTNPAWSFSKEESYGFMPHSRADTRPDDLEPRIPVVDPNEKETGSEVPYEEVQALSKTSIEDRYLGQSLETREVCGETKDHSSAKREEHSYDLKSELRWPDADDDLDSSGESDDTVIDAGWRVKSSELEPREHREDGWVELHNAQQNNETKKENVTVHEAPTNKSELQWTSQYSDTQTTFLADVTDHLTRSASKTPESPHSEDFVDLAETYGTDPNSGVTCYLESESLEDQVEENLTIEALRALADGTQEWNSESQESSPEILCPQFGSFERLKVTDSQAPAESFQDFAVDILMIKVHDLLFWRDVKKSGMVFGAAMVLLLSLAAFSIISVISYLVLSLLTVTISFRIYKSVMQAVQKSDEGHPFKALLDQDITLSSDSFQKKVSSFLVHINSALKHIVRLFLVEDLVDSLKLALFMWLMTYVGAVFNGITLLILGLLVAFTAPVVYEKYKVQIDHYVSLVHSQVKSITEKIQAKLPGALKKKTE